MIFISRMAIAAFIPFNAVVDDVVLPENMAYRTVIFRPDIGSDIVIAVISPEIDIFLIFAQLCLRTGAV